MDVKIRSGGVSLDGIVEVPPGAAGVVVFAHGSGSGRHSPRNVEVAASLGKRGFATVLFDLLTAPEDAEDRRTRALRFDIALLSERLIGAIDWLRDQPVLQALPVGLFGASTGAAAALVAAADRPEHVAAVVSRGGRPDLAGGALGRVESPTLLIVGERDRQVLTLNREAAALLAAHHEIAVVPGATHLFEEPGALAEVARMSADWFARFLGGDQGQVGH
jgi:dienelactone hydrolase